MQLPPEKLADFQRGYELNNLLIASAVPLVLTASAAGINTLSIGALFRGGSSATALIVALLAAQLALLWAARIAVRRLDRIPRIYWVQSSAQLLWIYALAWSSAPVVTTLALVILCAGAFNDSRYFYNPPLVHIHYLSTFPLFVAILLGIDVGGGEGLLAQLAADQGQATAALWLLGASTLLVQIIIAINGKQARALDEGVRKVERLERAQALVLQERRVLRRALAVLNNGLLVTKFAHDAASPLTTIELVLVELEFGLDPTLAEPMSDLKAAAAELSEMTHQLARATRANDPFSTQEIGAVVEEALDKAQGQLRGHGVSLIPPACSLEPAEVLVTAGHASSLANIIVNCVLFSRHEPLVILGASSSEGYRLSVRDHGVSPPERPAALARIRASILGERADEERPESHRGYGISLLLARILLVASGGALEVSAPPSGPGVQFIVTLPTTGAS